MMDLDTAIQVATLAHAQQKDAFADDLPYILHPLHVMFSLLPNVEQMTLAVLHDVMEDSPISAEDLAAWGASKEQLEVLDLLTRQAGVNYEDYIERLSHNRLARKIKLADIEHNMSRWGNECPASLRKRYEKAQRELMAAEMVDHA